jgi:hypothetical protein
VGLFSSDHAIAHTTVPPPIWTAGIDSPKKAST